MIRQPQSSTIPPRCLLRSEGQRQLGLAPFLLRLQAVPKKGGRGLSYTLQRRGQGRGLGNARWCQIIRFRSGVQRSGNLRPRKCKPHFPHFRLPFSPNFWTGSGGCFGSIHFSSLRLRDGIETRSDRWDGPSLTRAQALGMPRDPSPRHSWPPPRSLAASSPPTSWAWEGERMVAVLPTDLWGACG